MIGRIEAYLRALDVTPCNVSVLSHSVLTPPGFARQTSSSFGGPSSADMSFGNVSVLSHSVPSSADMSFGNVSVSVRLRRGQRLLDGEIISFTREAHLIARSARDMIEYLAEYFGTEYPKTSFTVTYHQEVRIVLP